eukprot:scaffold238267_cov33-Tisochrysis_lutea.AAC.1
MTEAKKALNASPPEASATRSYTLRALGVLVVAIVAAVYLGSSPPPVNPAPPRPAEAEAARQPVEEEARTAQNEHSLSTNAGKPQELEDKHPSCAHWAASGECARNPKYMGSSCARSCAGKLPEPSNQQHPQASEADATNARDGLVPITVDWSKPTLSPKLATAQTQMEDALAVGTLAQARWGCVDERDDCAELARWNLSACGEAPFMLTQCRKTCRTCEHQNLIGELFECEDKNEDCAAWAATGECEANRRYMLSSCSKACGVCKQKAFACARRNPVAGVLSPSGLTEMFQAALQDFPQYEPKLLSSDPPILQFENLITPEEAKAMIAIPGDKLVRSLAGDQLSPVRTSTQYWCDDSDGCTRNQVIEAVTRRMSRIARMPEENAEYFQILRYEPGQFYKTHHDQQTAHWTPQGVRVYTFFVYLSDVEHVAGSDQEIGSSLSTRCLAAQRPIIDGPLATNSQAGGGTRFVDLDLTVTPKLGRAILWPSVRAHDLLSGERKTHHEALPVEKGVKYSANLWIHLYDFKSPSRAGSCPFLGSNTHNGE